MRLLRYLAFIAVFSGIIAVLYNYSSPYQIMEGKIFGTYYKVKILSDLRDDNLSSKIKKVLADVNSQMSVFEEKSELSQINRAPAGKKVSISPELGKVMQAAAQVYQESGGAFDVSLGKLIDLWGFGAGKHQNPDTKEINEALKVSGFNKIEFAQDYSWLKKENAAVMINLSAIAKGYGVDKVAELLDREGYENYVIEIGGEVRAKGHRNSRGEPWNIGINRPASNKRDNIMVISLSNVSVATSGNYRNFYYENGQKIAHTISSKSGYPAEVDILSASVFHDSCMYADAYATALMAMDLKEGLAFADKYNIKAIIFDNQFKPHYSTATRMVISND